MGHWHGESPSDVTFAYYTKGCTVQLQIFVRYPFSYFFLSWNWFVGTNFRTFEGLKRKLHNYIEIWGPENEKKFHTELNLVLFSKVRKYEIKYWTKICDFTVSVWQCCAVDRWLMSGAYQWKTLTLLTRFYCIHENSHRGCKRVRKLQLGETHGQRLECRLQENGPAWGAESYITS